jgi:glycosyltransferase involved in cell wall biosynthesis
MKILYLYTEVMGYTMSTIHELVERDCDVHVIHLVKNRKAPLKFKDEKNVTFYDRSDYTFSMMLDLVRRIEPKLIVISGWVDKGYLGVAALLKHKGVPVVVGFDDQWKGTLKQKFASIFRLSLKLFFSHAWVSGVYQFEYAKRLGFSNHEIIHDLYSADLAKFNISWETKIQKNTAYPKTFLFVGRFEHVKAIDLLLEAWSMLSGKTKDWKLHLIGTGSLKNKLVIDDSIIVSDFMQPETLVKEIKKSGCFVLPSRHEPWGVVIHEFAAAGLPIICSHTVGAASSFVISGFNGFMFLNENSKSLASQMEKIICSSDENLKEMSKKSHIIGQRITPATSASNLLSVLEQK